MTDFMSHLAAFRARLTGDYVPAQEAARFIHYMRSQHDDILTDWMDDHARQWVTIELGRMRRSERARFAAGARARSFAGLAKAHMEGQLNINEVFEIEYVIDAEHTVRKFGDMTRTDVLYVADNYEDSGRRALLQAAYLRAVAKKMGNQKVAEVFTAEEILKLQQRVLGRGSRKAGGNAA